jgi:molecular chaperone DnaK
MKRTYDELQNKFQEVSADLYKQASAQAGPMPGTEAGGRPEPQAEPQSDGARKNRGDFDDAEFEVVDEDKNK